MGNPEHNIFKIGISRDVQKRLRTLKGGLPFSIAILATYELQLDEPEYQRRKALTVESALHRTFKAEHLQGEWFKDIDVEKFLHCVKEYEGVFLPEEKW